MKNSKGQVTIFIIIAIFIVAGILTFFTLGGGLGVAKIPSDFEPVYHAFLSCFEEEVYTGISVLESQGGYIFVPDFEPGSSHMPFSSQLNFLGNPIPYWYYVSGNNIEREQVPTKADMQDELGEFIETQTDNCDFSEYRDAGFIVSQEEPSARATIRGSEVEVNLKMDLTLVKGNETILVRNHKMSVDSNLGNLYDSAKKVYDEEQEELFLETYAIDVLRLYAPVDGVELTCSPLSWNAEEVFEELQDAIEANTHSLNTLDDEYFDLDLPVTEDVRFLTSKNWPHTFEVDPTDGPLLLANPVGNQQGLGILGFCYVSYHFVYDVKYPVLVQVFSGDEIFQFPMAVIIENNNPREALEGSAIENVIPELCEYKDISVTVNVRDELGIPIEADISYECLSNKCNIGKTSSAGSLTGDFPQCVNGYVVAKATGFKDTKYLFSTVSSGSIDLIMEKLYSKQIQLKLEDVDYNENAIVVFNSGDSSKTISYPDQGFVELGEGQYEIIVYIYEDSALKIEATVVEQCVEVPRTGILGVVGLKEEKCFEMKIPEQIISDALSAGGRQNHYILESELRVSDTIEINAQSLGLPETLEKLQENYLLFEDQGLEINLR